MARDLIVLKALSDLSAIPDSEHTSHPEALDLLLMLHYVYWGTTMPPAAYRVLERILAHVCDIVGEASTNGDAVDLEWLYIEPKTTQEIAKKLDWWKGEGKTATSFDEMLPTK